MSENLSGRAFLTGAHSQFGNVMVGRQEAVTTAAVGLVTNMNVGFAGGTGKFKTELMEQFPGLISDIDPANVAQVPIDNALSGIQIVGGESSLERRIERAGHPDDIEKIVTFLSGLVHEETQIVQLDEINRIPVKALNIFLSALEKRRIATTAGVRELPNLQLVMATMNPLETVDATNPVAHATISRFGLGWIFDRGGSFEQRVARTRGIADLPKEGRIEPITDMATILAMREAAKHKTISSTLEDHIARMSVMASDQLYEKVGLDDGEERLSVQVRRAARGLAVLNDEPEVNGQNVNEAMIMAISARVGMASPDAVELGPKMVREIVHPIAA